MKKIVLILVLIAFTSGCAVVLQRGRRSDIERIKALQEELQELKSTKISLEQRLAQEIDDDRVTVTMEEKGLVITFIAEVLFDSGKARLKTDSFPILDKVASILKAEVPDNNIGIEGHTDDQPIRFSKWKSNWELSAHRALSVLHYLEEKGIDPERLAAVGYGQFRPVSTNDTAEGKQLNRRVEVVILPKSALERKGALRGEEEIIYEEELK